MPRNLTQLDVPGSRRLETRILAACCPKCRKALIGDFEKGTSAPECVRCPSCSFSMSPPPADIIRLDRLCPDCGEYLWGARKARTLELDHIWCKVCSELKRQARLNPEEETIRKQYGP
jgi:predicted RNA-binding Zn-ribbon protein involved in translation (DUF1610 family)